MSRKITAKSDIKEKTTACAALQSRGYTFVEESETMLHITSGDLRGVRINLETGEIRGDSDAGHAEHGMALLRVAYAETAFRQALSVKGHQVVNRQVAKNGEVRLVCRSA